MEEHRRIRTCLFHLFFIWFCKSRCRDYNFLKFAVFHNVYLHKMFHEWELNLAKNCFGFLINLMRNRIITGFRNMAASIYNSDISIPISNLFCSTPPGCYLPCSKITLFKNIYIAKWNIIIIKWKKYLTFRKK